MMHLPSFPHPTPSCDDDALLFSGDVEYKLFDCVCLFVRLMLLLFSLLSIASITTLMWLSSPCLSYNSLNSPRFLLHQSSYCSDV